ncbi:MAG: TIGR02453 family protein [Prosthecochloris sp.]|nr:TIGR02453 family protein [Prosthecochloris sp.]
MSLQVTVDFLGRLMANNDREWFQEHKLLYDDARGAFEQFIAMLIPLVREIDPDVDVMIPKECIFRIFRDVRFSRDKSPYKTNFGAFIAKGGRKSPYAGYYLHIEPEASFVGGGAYMPESHYLKAIRNGIFENAEEYRTIIQREDFRKYFGGLFGEKLKTAPKGFPKDFPDIDLLKNKHYAVTHRVDDDFWTSEGMTENLKTIFSALYVFNRFLNNAISSAELK